MRVVPRSLLMSAFACVALASACNPASAGSRLAQKNDARVTSLDTPEGNEVIRIFREISALYRPSKLDEQVQADTKAGTNKPAVHAYLRQLVDAANAKLGANVITMQVDAAENVLITIPGTGRYANKNLNPIALQTHTDMVMEVDGVPSDADKTVFFRKGVQIAPPDEGWLHSVDYKTTLGADNAVGMAVGLRYLTQVGTEHPPVELLMTANEEQGLVGAFGLDLPVRATRLLNIDAESPNEFCFGALGGAMIDSTGRARAEAVPAGYRLVDIKISDLKGGHSGVNIHEGRVNAILAALQIYHDINKGIPDARLVDINGGDAAKKVVNAIPKSAELVIAVPDGNAKLAVTTGQETFAAIKAKATIEDAKSDNIVIKELGLTKGDAERGLTSAASQQLADALLSLENGPIEREMREGYPNRVTTSSNLGYLSLAPIPKSDGTAFAYTTGLMVRSYFNDQIASYADANVARLKSAGLDGSVEIKERPRFNAWLEDDKALWRNGDPSTSKSSLIRTAHSVFPKFPFIIVPGGLETSVLKKKLPNAVMLSLGINIVGAHSVKEKVEINSIHETTRDLQKLLLTLGDEELAKAK